MVTTGQAFTAQVQLTDDTGRDRAQLRVENIGGQIGNWLTNRHRVAALFAAGPVGDIDSRFGRTVKVVQPGLRQLGEHLLLGVDLQRFTTANDAFEAARLMHPLIEQEHLQHRRHKVQRADLMLLDQLQQARRITVLTRPGNRQPCAGHQRPEELPDRHVEAERGFLQHGVAGVQAVGLLHPAQTIGQRRMTIARPLRLAGGARGVDHVGEVFLGHGHVRVVRWVAAQVLLQQQDFDRGRNWQLLMQMLLS
ncbi:hypothetical protein D3C84_703900 [compost metagenome]